MVDEGARDRDSLLLTARKLMRKALFLARKAHQLEYLRHGRVDDVTLLADHLERERYVLVHGLIGQQPEVLEHRTNLAAQLGHAPTGQPIEVTARDKDVACRGAFFPQDELEKRRLAGTRGADEEDEVSPLDLHGDVVERGLSAARVDLADIVESDHGSMGARGRTRTSI